MKKGISSVVGLALGAGLLLYAIPRLDVGQGWTAPSLFAAVWLGMMLVIVSAYLYDLLGVDEETRKELQHVKRMRRWKMEQRLRSKLVVRDTKR
ncbi:hypothetical protein DUZ99_07200 [Xylanibacillus composti]|uniref:Uncharacterized protein n=1 Tax=Xylanibacillus composti TaxID=1572762 RepID=A0A8J4H2R6_9BACL|nr:hypothetical protein [Xylanibacillus composti]MDT9724779.1 hypothetical protein [Xylanibacillus composti]GIQ69868.1 hypothetical protein XYCOK13_26920 [Xylanibacillus composti]